MAGEPFWHRLIFPSPQSETFRGECVRMVIEFLLYTAVYAMVGFLFARFGLRTGAGPLTNQQAIKIAFPVGLAMAGATMIFGG